ncbi:MAG TPA: DUF4126 domain-containing protein [Micromonosporaceae bacterium]|jgi:uncharacterized membrane protein
MFEALTGIGLSASAGLNAWIPLLAIGLLNRYTHLIEVPAGWSWLSNGWVLSILAALLVIEMVADKVPIVDSANDVVQTVIRPTSGGIAFGASDSAQTVTVKDPTTFFHGHAWVGITTGVLIALFMHTLKASARPVINVATVGTGAPVISTIEDVASASMSFVAIVLPFLVIIFLALIIFGLWRLRRRMKARKARRAAAKLTVRQE